MTFNSYYKIVLVLGLFSGGLILGYLVNGYTEGLPITGHALQAAQTARIAGIPHQQSVPLSVKQVVANMGTTSDYRALAETIVRDAIQHDAQFSYDGRGYSASELATNPQAHSLFLEEIAYLIGGDTGGVDGPRVHAIIGDTPTIAGWTGQKSAQAICDKNFPGRGYQNCRLSSIYIPCLYRQYTAVWSDCSGMSVRHIFGCSDTRYIAWQEEIRDSDACALPRR